MLIGIWADLIGLDPEIFLGNEGGMYEAFMVYAKPFVYSDGKRDVKRPGNPSPGQRSTLQLVLWSIKLQLGT